MVQSKNLEVWPSPPVMWVTVVTKPDTFFPELGSLRSKVLWASRLDIEYPNVMFNIVRAPKKHFEKNAIIAFSDILLVSTVKKARFDGKKKTITELQLHAD